MVRIAAKHSTKRQSVIVINKSCSFMAHLLFHPREQANFVEIITAIYRAPVSKQCLFTGLTISSLTRVFPDYISAHQQQAAQGPSSGQTSQAQVQPLQFHPASPESSGGKFSALIIVFVDTSRFSGAPSWQGDNC